MNSKKIRQAIAFLPFISFFPAAFSAQELLLSAPQETLAAPQDTLAHQKLLKLPAPHRDLSVYDEGPAHVHATAVADSTLVIAPVQHSLPAPSAASSAAPKNRVVLSAKPVSPKKQPAASPLTDNLVDKQDQTKNPAGFSLQHTVGLDDDARVQINGFMTVGGLATTDPAYYLMPDYGLVRNDFNFAAVSRIGLQVTGNLMHNLAVVGQFVADGNNSLGHQAYNVTADWAYLRYTPRPEIQLRAGRFRLPTLFYSENAEVGYTYPWIVLPNEVYGIDPITNLNGVSSISRLALGQSNWTFKIQSFFGQSSQQAVFYNFYNPNFISGSVLNFSENNVYGGAASIGNPTLEFRASYMGFNTTVTAPLVAALCPNNFRQSLCTLANESSSDFYSLGAKLDIDHFLLVGEYAHRNIAAIISAIDSYYVMAAYSFENFMPNITYAYAATTNNTSLLNLGGKFPAVQDSVTLGLNYTINSNLLAKMSLSAIQPLKGTYGFFTTNPGRKTIMMYGVSLDAIF